MQRYCVKLRPDTVDILNDKIGLAIREATKVGYQLDNSTLEGQYDFIIASAHDSNSFTYKRYGKLILVVSYVPEMNSDTWAAFYVNLCMADIVACDSFCKEKLSSISFPEKRIINLDGCSLVKANDKALKLNDIRIPLVSLDHNPSIWNKFVEHVMSSSKGFNSKYTVNTRGITHNAVGIAFYPMGNTLATCMVSKLKHAMICYDAQTSVYLDARSNHFVGKTLGNVVNVSGGGIAAIMKDTFDIFLDEMETLLQHIETKPTYKFNSNANIYDRVFYEVNRATSK